MVNTLVRFNDIVTTTSDTPSFMVTNNNQDDSTASSRREYGSMTWDMYKQEVDCLAREKTQELERQRRAHLEGMKERYRRLSLSRAKAKEAAAQAALESSFSTSCSQLLEGSYSFSMLKKKLRKVVKMQDDILNTHGREQGKSRKSFKKCEKKRLEYLEALDQFEEWRAEQQQQQQGQEEPHVDDDDEQSMVSKATDTTVASTIATIDEILSFEPDEQAIQEEEEKERKHQEEAMEADRKHRESLLRQKENQKQIDFLRDSCHKLSLDRIKAEEAAERAAQINRELGDSADFLDFEDNDDDDSDDESEEDRKHRRSLERQEENKKEIETLKEKYQRLSMERIAAEKAADDAAERNRALGDSSDFLDLDSSEEDKNDETLPSSSSLSPPTPTSPPPPPPPPAFSFLSPRQSEGSSSKKRVSQQPGFPIFSPVLSSPEPRQSFTTLKSQLRKLERMQKDILEMKGEEGRKSKRFAELEEQRLECSATLDQSNGYKLQQLRKIKVAE